MLSNNNHKIPTITKMDLTKNASKQAGLSKNQSADLIDRMFSLITESLEQGKNVKLSNFGTFQLIDKAERVGRNLRTNEQVMIAPRKVVTFKAAAKLSKRVNIANSALKTAASTSLNMSEKKRQVLKALENKIGTNKNELDFIFKPTSAKEISKDVEIPDIRKSL